VFPLPPNLCSLEFGRYGDATQPIAVRVIAAQISMLGTTFAALALAALFAERRRSEAALGESDTRLRSILDAASVIAWNADLTRHTVHSAGPVTRLGTCSVWHHCREYGKSR
jgi:hypothetical protein